MSLTGAKAISAADSAASACAASWPAKACATSQSHRSRFCTRATLVTRSRSCANAASPRKSRQSAAYYPRALCGLIVLGGVAAVEKAARDAGHDVTVPFTPGRTDATQEQADVESVDMLQPASDGFRNYQRADYTVAPAELLIDKAQLLTLTAAEMTALIGGMRVLGTNTDGSNHGVFTDRPGVLTNDFFNNLLSMATEWRVVDEDDRMFEGRDRKTGELRWIATQTDLIFGSDSQLRGLAEIYAGEVAEHCFVDAFIAAWAKVMDLDRFDVK